MPSNSHIQPLNHRTPDKDEDRHDTASGSQTLFATTRPCSSLGGTASEPPVSVSNGMIMKWCHKSSFYVIDAMHSLWMLSNKTLLRILVLEERFLFLMLVMLRNMISRTEHIGKVAAAVLMPWTILWILFRTIICFYSISLDAQHQADPPSFLSAECRVAQTFDFNLHFYFWVFERPSLLESDAESTVQAAGPHEGNDTMWLDVFGEGRSHSASPCNIAAAQIMPDRIFPPKRGLPITNSGPDLEKVKERKIVVIDDQPVTAPCHMGNDNCHLPTPTGSSKAPQVLKRNIRSPGRGGFEIEDVAIANRCPTFERRQTRPQNIGKTISGTIKKQPNGEDK